MFLQNGNVLEHLILPNNGKHWFFIIFEGRENVTQLTICIPPPFVYKDGCLKPVIYDLLTVYCHIRELLTRTWDL
ncbi:hypothetical protein Y1Q_0002226 [Alligator mississippiensis]|uniref:Uncharacterized protein n=1 Tax=Alligator mississippiensis TaxID=8496 RepID=A0A151MGE3_ALLMI|nr:hypothetical protein Y1Q_0002226 [Alligator mississippiensis]